MSLHAPIALVLCSREATEAMEVARHCVAALAVVYERAVEPQRVPGDVVDPPGPGAGARDETAAARKRLQRRAAIARNMVTW